MYELLTGYLFWLSLAVFFIGCLVRLVLYFLGLDWQLDRVAYTAHRFRGAKGAWRSIYKWLLPFGTRSWRQHPVMTFLFFGFHAGAILVPLFLLAHNTFLEHKIGISLFTLNTALADILTWMVIVTAFFLILRRLALPQVRILSTWSDYLILVVAVAPFITGLLARYEVSNYSFWLLTHILCGELLLVLTPFTRLSHMVLFFASRAQLGMDFGIKRGGLRGTPITW
ncbi:MAG: sulfate respiration complex protein HmcE [Desulfosudaceae bacterium]